MLFNFNTLLSNIKTGAELGDSASQSLPKRILDKFLVFLNGIAKPYFAHTNEKSLPLLRVFHLCSSLLIIILYFVFALSSPVTVFDSLNVRIALTSISGLLIISSYFNSSIRRNFMMISYIGILIYSTWIFYMLYVTNFSSQFVIIYFILMAGINLSIRAMRPLTLFSVFSIATYSLIIIFTPTPNIDPYNSIAILLVMQGFIYFLLWEKLNYKKLIFKKNQELVNKNNEILDSINYARYLQEAVLPQVVDINTFLPNSFIYYKPKDIVSGDFFWIDKKDDKIVIVAADCTGHGVPGALLSMLGSVALNEGILKNSTTKPSDILNALNQFLFDVMSHKKNHPQTSMMGWIFLSVLWI